MTEIACSLRLVGLKVEERQQSVDFARKLDAMVLPLQSNFEVLTDRQSLEHARHLEFDREPAVNARKGFQRSDVLAGEHNIAAAGVVFAEDQPEQRALAGAVRADQAMDFTGFEFEVDRIGDVQAAEMLVQTAQFEQRHQTPPLPRCTTSRERRFMAPSTSPFGAISTVSTSSTPMKTSAYWLP